MSAEPCDRCRENSNKFSARNNFALAQLLDLMVAWIGELYVKLNAGMFLGKSPRDGWHQAVQNDVGASQPHFARVWIREIFQRAKTLLHFVEYICAASKQNFSIGGQLSALRSAVQQSHAERTFDVGYRLGDRRMRNSQLGAAFAMLPVSAIAMRM
jgi:hypothetical protein